MATTKNAILQDLRKIIHKTQQDLELEQVMQPLLHTLKDFDQDDKFPNDVANCVYDKGVSSEEDVIPAVKVGVKIHNSKIFGNSFALALLKRCKTDFDNRNYLIEDEQLMQLDINIWFVCNMYANCKNLDTGKNLMVLYGAIIDYLMTLITKLRKLDTARDALLFTLANLKEDEKLSERAPNLTTVFETAEKLLEDSTLTDDASLILKQIVEINPESKIIQSDEPNKPENDEREHKNSTAELYDSLNYSLDELSVFPGNTTMVTQSIIENLKFWSQDESVMSKTASLIFNKAVADANFRYTAAVICKSIHESSVFAEDKFRYYLLRECQKLFESKEKFEKKAMFGGALFTAEIYLTFKSGNSPILKLHDAILSYMRALIANTDKDHIKCITSLLKLVGSSMDQYEKDQGKVSSLNEVFEKLKTISEATSNQSIKDIIANVVKLRASNWGMIPKQILNPNAAEFRPTPKSNKNSSITKDTAKFNPDAPEFHPSHISNSIKYNLRDQQEQPVRDIATWNEYIGDDDDFNAELFHEQESMFQYLEEEMIDDDMEQEYEKFLANQ